MQAAQSNKAPDFFKSDSTGTRDIQAVNGRIRDLPSPFTTPIQAARKYLERQRGCTSLADSGVMGVARNLPKDQERQPARAQAIREQITRDQDRRLERSLYEGHSIEAGLNFEESHGFAESGRAHLADSDGSEPLFPYASPGPASRQVPDHDPETVRGAIFRLARESGAIESSTVWETSEATPAPGKFDGPVEVLAAHPSAFADVARRVWGGDLDVREVSAPAAAISVERRDEISGAPSYLVPELRESVDKSFDSTEEIHAQVAPASPVVAKQQSLTSQPHTVEVQAAEIGRGSAFEDAALAHDACNLLSALGLYSDLLNFPGVLDEQHRHYAKELKLIAGRSQVLIDRMLTLGDAARTRSTAAESGPERSAGVFGESAREGSAAMSLSGLPQSQLGSLPNPGATEEATARAILPGQQRDLHAGIHVTPKPVAVTGGAGENATSLVDLLMCWGSLLSTLAHGTLDVCFGPDAATPVPMEAELLERILVNLVRNARAATIAGGAIRIGVGISKEDWAEATGSGQTMVLTVDDSGCGMTEAQIDRVLGAVAGKGVDFGMAIEPEGKAAMPGDRGLLFQAGAETVSDGYGRWKHSRNGCGEDSIETTAGSARAPRGNQGGQSGNAVDGRRQGLGLQVVKELVSASGGRLTIQSSPGRGTRVEIRWPVAAASVRIEEPIPITRLDVATTGVKGPSLQVSPMELQPLLKRSPPVAVGPDGFSEPELRAMMLRLHRQGTPPTRFEASRSEAARLEADIYSAVKGAIAC